MSVTIKKSGLACSLSILTLFCVFLSNYSNNSRKIKYLNCIKLSIKHCKHDTLKRKDDIIKNCRIVIKHNQEISQVENFYTCKQRKK